VSPKPRGTNRNLAVQLQSHDPFERALALLEPKRQRFVREWLKDRNATQAARRAGYSAKSADVTGCRLLGDARVAAAIHEGELKEQAEDATWTARLKRRVQRGCMFELRDLLDPVTGDVLPPSQWPPDIAPFVIGVEFVMKNAEAGDGAIDRVLKIKTINPVDAWKLEYGRLGLLEGDGGEVPADVPAFIVAEKVLVVNPK
jgi:phage terminase small subunit